MVVWLIKLVESDYQFSASNSKWKLINNVLERNSLTRIYPGTNGYRIRVLARKIRGDARGWGVDVIRTTIYDSTMNVELCNERWHVSKRRKGRMEKKRNAANKLREEIIIEWSK